MLGNETLDYFRFAIRPENIDPPARPGIFPRHESWSLLGHPSNMRLWRPGSSQLSCHNQTDPQQGLELAKALNDCPSQTDGSRASPSLLFPKDGCVRLVGLPPEEIISARPCVDLDPANLAIETARTLVWMLFLGRSVRHPAIGAVEIFGRPYAASHRANRPASRPFSARPAAAIKLTLPESR
jgi:hypothetical protein